MSKVKGLAERSFWQKFKDGFKPPAARADDNIAENRMKTGNKLAEDMQLSSQDRAKKVQKGFFGK